MRINRPATAILVLIAVSALQGGSVVAAQTAGGRTPETYPYTMAQFGFPQGELTIIMTDDAQFMPGQITIPVGTTVTWQNASNQIYSVTDVPGSESVRGDTLLPPWAYAFDSGNIGPGRSYSHTFTVTGRYIYFSRGYEMNGMVGEITVIGN